MTKYPAPDAEYRKALTQAHREGFSGEQAYEQAAAIVIQAKRERTPGPLNRPRLRTHTPHDPETRSDYHRSLPDAPHTPTPRCSDCGAPLSSAQHALICRAD